MALEPNAVFIGRHSSYARILQICQRTSEYDMGFHKRHLVQQEGDDDNLISVFKTNGECMFLGRVFESGREGFTIIQKDEINDHDYCLYKLLGVKAVSEEDIWL